MNNQLFFQQYQIIQILERQRQYNYNEEQKKIALMKNIEANIFEFFIKTYLINLDRSPERLQVVFPRLLAAGFTNIERISGVDGVLMHINKTLSNEWEKHGSPKFANHHSISFDKLLQKHIGREGCMLSHLNIWKKIIEMENIEDRTMFTVFEDDIDFHEKWNKLVPDYYNRTPKDFDILFIGNEIDIACADTTICKLPTYCTHAYIITRAGAQKLYNLLLNYPNGIYTIDHMLYDYMKAGVCPFNWYCWVNPTIQNIRWKYSRNKKTTGLVLQNDEFPSLIIR